MKLEAEQSALKTMLTKLIGAVEKRNTIPSLSNVALIAADGVLMGKTTDLDIEVTVNIPATVSNPGSTTVNAAMIAALVAKMKAGTLVSISLDDHVLHINSGRSKYDLQTLPLDDFPQMASSEYSHTFTIQAHELSRLFNLTKGAMSTEEARYYLQGVYLHPSKDNDIVAVATDGHRLHKITAPHHVDFPGVIVPRKAVGEIGKMLDIGDVVVSVSETKIRFDMGDTILVSKVIDGTFPAYDRIIPTDNRNIVTADASEMKAASDRVATMADDRSRAVKLTIEDGVALLSTRGNVGSAEEEVAVGYAGKRFEFGFNSRYLADVLSLCAGQDVVMEFGNDVNSPVIVKPGEDDRAMFFVMGMRV